MDDHHNSEKKKQVPCILLSDSSSEKVSNAPISIYEFICLFFLFPPAHDWCREPSLKNLVPDWRVDSLFFEQSEQEDACEETTEKKGTPKQRKKIRKIIEDSSLCAETQEALREEEERCKRLANRDQQMEDRREVLQTGH